MIRKEDFAVIQSLRQCGVYQKDMAAELNVHPKTVSRALQRQGAPERECVKRGSKCRHGATATLDTHKGRVDQLLSEGVWNARVILREIRAEGYDGGYSILLDAARHPAQAQSATRAGHRSLRNRTGEAAAD